MSDKEKRDPKFKVAGVLSRQTFWEIIKSNLKTVVGSDLRSLALFRIFLGLTVIWDLINRYSDIHAHYSDAGILPRHVVLTHFQNDLWISLHLMSGLASFQTILFLLHGLFTFFMMIGFYTKTSTFITWFLMGSLHSRNIFVLHGGDILGRMLLFWAMFLPLGDCYSIDNAFYGKRTKKNYGPKHYQIATVATFALSMQFSLMYITSYLHKSGKEWTEYRTATWLALQLDYFRTPFGDFFLNFPELLKILTKYVLLWEGFGPVFYYIPLFAGPFRTFGVLGTFAMHMGFSLCLRLGQFATVALFGCLGMLPTWFWESIVFRHLRTKERLGFKLFYNPNSLWSTRFALFMSNFFLIPETQVIPSDSQSSSKKPLEDDFIVTDKKDEDAEVIDVIPSRTFSPVISNSWLLVQDHRGVQHSDVDALILLFHVSPLLWPFKFLVRRKSIGNFIRGFMHSQIPSWMDSKESPANRGPFSPRVTPGSLKHTVRLFWRISKVVLLNLTCLFFTYFVFTWNMGNIGYGAKFPAPTSLRWMAYFLHLDQSWAMFSPRPPSVQWYYIIEAELDNTTKCEIFRNEGMFRFECSDLTWDPPDPFYKSFKNHRWFKFYENGVNSHPNNDILRLNWGRYICREWNARHTGPDRLYKFSIHWMNERAEPDKPRIRQPKQTIWNHICYDKK